MMRTSYLAPAFLAAAAACSSRINVLQTHADASSTDLKSFSPKQFRAFPIKKITDISHNTKAIEVALPSANHEMGCPTASCIMVKGATKEDGKFDARPYTPTTLDDEKGHFELIIKTYPEGKVSKYIHSLKVGDNIEVKGPFPKLSYKANFKKKIGMIAGGTGITPMLQVIKEILKNPDDKTEIHLVFANQTEQDILLKSTLDELARKHKNFKVTYVLSKAGLFWRGEKGFVSAAIIAKSMPAPGPDSLVLVCGPPGLMKSVSGDKTPDYKQGPVEGLLKDVGYTEDMVYKF